MAHALRVLAVEDESDVLDIILTSLKNEGHQTQGVLDSSAALAAVDEYRPDMLIVDRKMPRVSGDEIVRIVRGSAVHSELPIIMVTAGESEKAMLESFRLGIDDYILKPFSPVELAARVRAVARRSRFSSTKREFRSDKMALVVDYSAHRVQVAGRDVVLTLTEFKLLNELAMNAGQVLSREQLRSSVLGGLHVSDRTIDVHVAALRKKLETAGEAVETVRGIGYRLSI